VWLHQRTLGHANIQQILAAQAANFTVMSAAILA
jgi:hypothetical protein